MSRAPINPCHTRAAIPRRLRKMENAEMHVVRSPVDAAGSHRTPSDGVHFEHAKQTPSFGVPIRAQWDRQKVAIASITPQELRRRKQSLQCAR